MTLGLTVAGGEQLAASLRALGAAVRRKALLDVLRPAAEPMRGRMVELAPIGFVDDVHIKDSDHIRISPVTKIGSVAGGAWAASDENQAAVAVGPTGNFFYGLYLEYGTTRIAAQPFMRPAFDATVDRSITVIRDGLWDLLEEATRQVTIVGPSGSRSSIGAGVFAEGDQ